MSMLCYEYAKLNGWEWCELTNESKCLTCIGFWRYTRNFVAANQASSYDLCYEFPLNLFIASFLNLDVYFHGVSFFWANSFDSMFGMKYLLNFFYASIEAI